MNWKWNGYHFLSFKPSFPQKGPVHIHASPLSGCNVLGWVSISEPSCNSTFMLFESFYAHDLISSSRTGWASNIIPISKIAYVEWQRSNVTCSRSPWQWVIKFWPMLITINVEHLLQVYTKHFFFEKFPTTLEDGEWSLEWNYGRGKKSNLQMSHNW